MKPYQFQFSGHAERDFVRLPLFLQKRILDKLHFFEKSENPLKFAKRLKGFENWYRFRIGDYRVIVARKEEKIIIVLVIIKIGHRREVYE